MNLADLSRTLPLPYTTLQRYMALLEAIYLVKLLPAWSNNLGTRLLKTPKILLTDSGLAGYLMGISESRDGRLVGVEVKASTSVSRSDFRGLRTLQASVGGSVSVGGKFHRGILLYTGQHVLPFGEGLFAAPLSALWG